MNKIGTNRSKVSKFLFILSVNLRIAMGCVRIACPTEIQQSVRKLYASQAMYSYFSEWVRRKEKDKTNNILTFSS